MKNLIDLEKKINSELTTKINKTEVKHNPVSYTHLTLPTTEAV